MRSLCWSVSPPRWDSISSAPLNWLSLLKRREPINNKASGGSQHRYWTPQWRHVFYEMHVWLKPKTLFCLCNFTLTFIFWGGILWSFSFWHPESSAVVHYLDWCKQPFSLPHLLSPELVLTAQLSNCEHAPTLHERSGLLETVNQGGIRWPQALFMTDYTLGAPTFLLCVIAYYNHKDTVKTCFCWTRTWPPLPLLYSSGNWDL